jgi:hypothetical protein
MSSFTNIHSLIEAPISIRQSSISVSKLVESPIKGSSRRLSKLVASPLEKTRRTNALRLVEPPQFLTSKTTSRKRIRPSKPSTPRKKKGAACAPFDNWDGGFGDDDGGFGFSPEKDSEAKDVIDWTSTSVEVETLKSMIVPKYWELLVNAAHAVVRVTKRLYILQDWNRIGYLMV